MELHPLKKKDVTEKLAFAKRRFENLINLNGGDLSGADGSERQQLLQEFFFHLVGSIDLLAQLLNEISKLGLKTKDVNVKSVSEKLLEGEICDILNLLYTNVIEELFPAYPY